jgi:hypothetical protein
MTSPFRRLRQAAYVDGWSACFERFRAEREFHQRQYQRLAAPLAEIAQGGVDDPQALAREALRVNHNARAQHEGREDGVLHKFSEDLGEFKP